MTSVQQQPASESAGTPDIHTTAGKLADLRNRLEEAQHPMGEAAVDKVHAKGKMTARERILALVDEGSFVELDALAKHRSVNFGLEHNRPLGDGVVTGYGTIDGRDVCIFSQDVTVFGGSLGEVYGEKIVKVMDLAIKTGRPLVGINEGSRRAHPGRRRLARPLRRDLPPQRAGLRRDPTDLADHGCRRRWSRVLPALTDFVVMVDQTSQMFVTGPDVIKTVTGEEVSMEDLGGAHTHMVKSGVAHYVASGEQDALDYVKDLLSYLPSNNRAEAPRHAPTDPINGAIDESLTDEDIELDTIIPDSPNQPYDMHEVIRRLLDDDEFLEVQAERAMNIICGFGRVDGRSVGIVANQPMQFAGCLDIDASEKAARFVRTCDAFNVPIITLVDVPGFLPGTGQEYNGIIRRGAKLLYAYGEATVGKITIITRKAYGGAYDVMGSKHMGADVNLAWPTAQIAVMGASGAVGFVYRKQLADAAKNGDDVDALRLELQNEYEDTLVNPYVAAERGYVDAVIPPSHTRGQIVSALRLLERKMVTMPPKKHGNIPL